MPDRIRLLELRSVRGTGGGPEKTILLGATRMDPDRFAVTICYLRDDRNPVFAIDERAKRHDLRYVEIRERHSFDFRVWPALRQLIRDDGIQIVHGHDYKTDLLALLLARVEPVAALATAHGWTGHSVRERRLYYPLDKRVLVRLPKVIAVSEQVRRELIAAGADEDRVVTVLNGIDHRAFRRTPGHEASVRADLGLNCSEVVIGAVGRLEPQKRFDLLLQTLAALSPRHPNLRLFIVGEGSLRTSLEAKARELGVEGICRFLGQRSDIADLHHAFQIFVQSSDYEGTSNAVLEAMALETPIVATDAGGTSEMVRAGIDGLIVPMGDPVALRTAINEVLSDQEAARVRAVNARRRVEEDLSFDSRTSALERICEQLVKRQNGH